jgi:hypothetical protein
MKKDKIQEAYELMLTEKKVEVEATLESILDYLHFFEEAKKKKTLEGDMELAKTLLDKISKYVSKIQKSIK